MAGLSWCYPTMQSAPGLFWFLTSSCNGSIRIFNKWLLDILSTYDIICTLNRQQLANTKRTYNIFNIKALIYTCDDTTTEMMTTTTTTTTTNTQSNTIQYIIIIRTDFVFSS